MEQISWFDLELTNGILTDNIKEKALKIFNSWKNNGVQKLPEQRIAKWRPKKNVALVTATEDILKLYKQLENQMVMNLPGNVTFLFENETVLRLRIE